jgi:hypothetical protein
MLRYKAFALCEQTHIYPSLIHEEVFCRGKIHKKNILISYINEKNIFLAATIEE